MAKCKGCDNEIISGPHVEKVWPSVAREFWHTECFIMRHSVRSPKRYECLNCGWRGEELETVRRMGEADCIYMSVEVCPLCQDVAVEELDSGEKT